MGYIEVRDVVKRFGKTVALRGVSLTIKRGELFAILGPSGCGKTTLLRVIAGFEVPDSGKVYIDGEDVTEKPPDKRGTVMVFQNWALWPHMTVYENIAFGLKLRKLPKSEIDRRVKWVLDLLGLQGLENRFPGQLSGGQQQRVALARALVVQPRVLLLDEPLSNLDAKLRLRLRGELKKLQRQLDITMVYVTHDQEEAMALADRMAVMREGMVEQVGTPEELYTNPKTLFTAMFLGRTSLVIGKVVDIESDYAIVAVGRSLFKAVNHGLGKGDEAAIVIKADGARTRKPENPENYTIISGKVTVSMYLGLFNEVRLVIEDSSYEVMFNLPGEEELPKLGSKAEIYVPLKNVHAFPVEEEIVKTIAEQT
ncbi:ABC transporter ATP-binding protein [Hyperthermus butylicus]|uniref:Molybdate/tungstate import ATP-binding protein WtpC n=1 Tax=Hyperthermus butylicus (strain DSM 5456 / JCM 9403 / PLM1-5) TaxID=415426 RepID=A2BIY1_HYPBU|nr:ABC transporter ATP-binding protein [Hyperthermus butylicus]ABM79942.1 ABC-type, ATP binding, spermidine/spermine transporter, PotA [Hyperthermus butylicus DSM 5456]